MYTTCLSRHSTAISLVMHLAPAGKMGSCNCGMDSSVWLTWSAGASQKVAQAHSSDSRRRGVDFRRSETRSSQPPRVRDILWARGRDYIVGSSSQRREHCRPGLEARESREYGPRDDAPPLDRP